MITLFFKSKYPGYHQGTRVRRYAGYDFENTTKQKTSCQLELCLNRARGKQEHYHPWQNQEKNMEIKLKISKEKRRRGIRKTSTAFSRQLLSLKPWFRGKNNDDIFHQTGEKTV